ncbi:putative transcription factor iiic-like protein [Erysiphe neolycopersici]|uniref:Putative transcription factor iiic-like protein n=1 Tax=Erysiphe neolycopersici TaxID=212602 RepID=A0A420HPK1_9PEZI|nr:putative transcription factor iiic-like protein [Erysiphe neolycopersici]
MPRSNLAQMARRKQQTRLNFESAYATSSPIQSSSTKVKTESSDDLMRISSDSNNNKMNSNNDCQSNESFKFKHMDVQLAGKTSEQNTGGKLCSILKLHDTRVHAISRDAKNKKSLVNNNGLDSSEGSDAESDIILGTNKASKPEDSLICQQRPIDTPLPNTDTLKVEISKPNIQLDSSEGVFEFAFSIKKLQKPLDGDRSYICANKNVIVIDSSDDESFITSPNILKSTPYQETSSPLKRHRILSVDQVSKNDSSPACHFPTINLGDSEDSEEIVSPVKRRCHTRYKEKRINSNTQSLVFESNSSLLQKCHTRQHKKKRHRTDKEKALELMKRKRAGEKIEFLTDTELSSDGASDDKFEVLSVFEDDDESVEQNESSSKAIQVEGDTDSNDSNFVVNNDEGPLGIPDYMSIVPLQFTHTAHKPLKEHFRDAIEWMVKNKIFPAFARDDEVYLQAFRKLDDICQGLSKSKFISTQWTMDFTQAIWTYPYLISGPLSEGEGYDFITAIPKCDACNRRKHIPTSFLQFKGQAYDRNTLVVVDQRRDINNISKARNNKLQIEQIKWCVGSICKRNAQYSHSLIHWKFALNEWVIDFLSKEGQLTSEKIMARRMMDSVELDQYANHLVDTWESKSIIKYLYRDWKIQRKIAEELT